jgi:23S rRNA pseudouridine955/2504/2580 synthase
VAQPTPKARLLSVGDEDAGQRLDNFLFRQLKGVPKGHVYRLLRTGQVRVNSRRVKPDYRLQAGDDVRLPPVRQEEKAAPGHPPRWQQEALQQALLYEDDQLLIVNKPAGMAVHGGSGISFGVIETLRVLRPDAPSLELAHRLDRDTSGCLVVAKRRSALRGLHTLFREGRVDKRYLALLAGAWRGGERSVAVPLEKNRLQSGERMVKVSGGGKQAESLFRPMQKFTDATLMEVRIFTGRTHQIRVHAAHIGHPVAGDDKYGDWEANKRFKALGLKRMFLHAHSLAFEHPLSGVPVSVTAPLDEELQAFLKRLAAV